MKMHNPPHPGEVLRELCLQPLGLTVTEAAAARALAQRWRSVCRSPSAPLRRAGSASSSTTIWRRQRPSAGRFASRSSRLLDSPFRLRASSSAAAGEGDLGGLTTYLATPNDKLAQRRGRWPLQRWAGPHGSERHSCRKATASCGKWPLV
jgi:hypothetical protein